MQPSKQSILFVTPFFPPYDVGGMELSLKLLAQALADSGWKVQIVTPGYGETTVRTEGKNPEVIYVPWSDNRNPSSLFQPWAARRFARFALQHAQRASIVDAYSWPQPARLIADQWHIPMVASIRDATFISDLRASDKPVRLSVAKYFSQRFAINGRSPLQFVYGLYGYARTAYTWNALKRADHITYASEALHDLFHELKVPGEAVYSVANPDNFTPPAFAIPNRDKKMPLFVYAGRLNKGKGAIFLYDAAVSLLKAGEQFQIAFIGKGELAPTLEETKWSKNLLGLGRLSREETLSVMQQATATVVPSLVFEGFPRAGIESISVGTPVIGTEVGGIPEAVGTAGIIIQPHDTKALTKTLQQLIHEPAVLKKLQAAAQREKGLYTPAAMCKRVEKIYMQLIKSRTS